MELGACLDRVRERRPLIHCITNYVTVNDVANKLLNHVEKLSTTASVLDENMEGLKNEISVFKI